MSRFYHKDIFFRLCYNGSIKAKEMVMCPRCKEVGVESKLIAMSYPDDKAGIRCPMCAREWWYQEPSEYVREPVVRGSKLGKDVYTTSDPKRD